MNDNNWFSANEWLSENYLTTIPTADRKPLKVQFEGNTNVSTITPNSEIYSVEPLTCTTYESLLDEAEVKHIIASIFDNYGIEMKPIERNNDMTITKTNDNLFGNFDFGPCDDSIKMSMYGMAVKNQAGTYVAYDKNSGKIMDVDILNFNGGKFFYKMPVAIKDIKVGDIVIHSRKPMFVTSVENGIQVIDIFAGEQKVIIPTHSCFGFDFVTKIVSLFGDAFNAGASENSPFGNMLPFMLMGDGNLDMKTVLLMNYMNGNAAKDFNPLMFMLLDDKNSDNILPIMCLMSNDNNPFAPAK